MPQIFGRKPATSSHVSQQEVKKQFLEFGKPQEPLSHSSPSLDLYVVRKSDVLRVFFLGGGIWAFLPHHYKKIRAYQRE